MKFEIKIFSIVEWIVHSLVWIGMAFVLAHTVYDGDIWWHIAVGREISQTGSLPEGDEWSFTAPGIPYVHHSWLSDVLFYWIWINTGES